MDQPRNIRKLSGVELKGWCIQYRVWVYGSDGSEIPEPYLRRSLDCAVQHYRIYGRLWEKRGGLGYRDEHKHYPIPTGW